MKNDRVREGKGKNEFLIIKEFTISINMKYIKEIGKLLYIRLFPKKYFINRYEGEFKNWH